MKSGHHFFTAQSSGTHNLIFQYTEKNKNCTKYTAPKSIQIKQLPLFTIIGPEKVCINNENKFAISNAKQYKVRWELPSNTKLGTHKNDSIALTFTKAETAIIKALIYDTLIANFPIAEIEKKITTGSASKVSIEGDSIACVLNFPYKYTITDTANKSYWHTNATMIDSHDNSISLQFTESKNYFLTLEFENEYNCHSTDSISIRAIKTPLIGKNKIIKNCFTNNPNFEYVADNEYSYFEIDSIKTEKNILNFRERDILLCHYSDSFCIGTDTVFIVDSCNNDSWVAKTFSINNNETDENLILNCANDSLVSFKIMTNEGLVLFKSKNQDQKWDGLYRKKAVEFGFYPWELKYKNWKEEIITKTGKIEIKE
ncbi:MAG: hypothetical protein IPO21_02520 [Bacteroidales bacterium]|nr:hypothetical protein [Bacteroidales bacterium]